MEHFFPNLFKFSSITALAVVMLFSSCEKDKRDDKKDTEVTISGKWILKKEISKDYINGKLDEEETDIEEYSGNNNYFEFKNGKIKIVNQRDGENDAIVIPYTISSDSKKIILSCKGEDCFIESGFIEIKNIDSKKLILYIEQIEILEGVTYKYTTELHFVKI